MIWSDYRRGLIVPAVTRSTPGGAICSHTIRNTICHCELNPVQGVHISMQEDTITVLIATRIEPTNKAILAEVTTVPFSVAAARNVISGLHKGYSQ